MTPFNPLVLQGNLGILSPNLKPVSENSLIEHENGQIQARLALNCLILSKKMGNNMKATGDKTS